MLIQDGWAATAARAGSAARDFERASADLLLRPNIVMSKKGEPKMG